MHEVFPPYWSVVGPGVGIEPRTPQNLIRTGVARGKFVGPGLGEENIASSRGPSGLVRMFPRFAISPLEQIRCRRALDNLTSLIVPLNLRSCLPGNHSQLHRSC